jgi:hypothetical protein
MAGRRVDEVPGNVFAVSGRINSTWGGGLADMVRSRRMLEVIERDQLFDRAAAVGSWFLAELKTVASRYAGLVSNVRGRGLNAPSTCGCRAAGTRQCRAAEEGEGLVLPRPGLGPIPPRADHRGGRPGPGPQGGRPVPGPDARLVAGAMSHRHREGDHV